MDVYSNTQAKRELAPMRLRIMEGEHELRRAEALPENPDEQEMQALLRFSFPAIPDSGSRQLAAELTDPGATDATVFAPFAIRYWNPPPSTPLTYKHALVAGLRYGPGVPIYEQLGGLVRRLSTYHPLPFKGAGIVVLFALSVIAVMGLLWSLPTLEPAAADDAVRAPSEPRLVESRIATRVARRGPKGAR